jgi:hypothetical protein
MLYIIGVLILLAWSIFIIVSNTKKKSQAEKDMDALADLFFRK